MALLPSLLVAWLLGGSRALHPDYPIVEGRNRMTAHWSIRLTESFNRRFEGDDLVLWKPGLTMWVSVFQDGLETRDEQRARIEGARVGGMTEIEVVERGNVRYWMYRLEERVEDDRRPAFYCQAFSGGSHLSMGIYFDVEREAETARALCLSLRHEK